MGLSSSRPEHLRSCVEFVNSSLDDNDNDDDKIKIQRLLRRGGGANMAENSNNTFQRTMSSLGGGGPSAPQPASSSAGKSNHHHQPVVASVPNQSEPIPCYLHSGLLTFDIISSAATTSGPSAVQAERQQPVDRFKQLYPNVNEEETPLPRFWSTQDKCNTIGLTQNNLRVHYKGKQEHSSSGWVTLPSSSALAPYHPLVVLVRVEIDNSVQLASV